MNKLKKFWTFWRKTTNKPKETGGWRRLSFGDKCPKDKHKRAGMFCEFCDDMQCISVDFIKCGYFKNKSFK